MRFRLLFLAIALWIAIPAWTQSRTADVESAYAKLKEAEGKKDPDGVLEWAEKTSAAARAVVASPKPDKADEVESWTNAVDYAKQVDTYTEYSEYATAMAGVPLAKMSALIESIEKRNPKSEYLAKVYPTYLVSLSQTGQADKLMAVAEGRIQHDPTNEDLLLVLADGYGKKKQPEKATTYALKLVEVLKEKPKPEGLSAEDWTKKKNSAMATGYWIAGVNHAEAKRYKEADAALRAALPLVAGQPSLEAPTLFYLGVANYNLGKPTKDKKLIAEAIKFSDACAKLASPYKDSAAKNAKGMRVEFGMK
jgi:hypothetical protein